MCSAVLVQEVLQRRREPWRWERSGRPSEIDNNPLRGSLKPTLIQLHEKLPKNSASTVLWSFNIWSKLERWKGSISGCLMSWLKIKKIIVLKCRLLLFYATTDNFLVRLWCAMKSGFYSITGDNQLSGWTEKKLQSTSQSQTWTKKGHGECLAVCGPAYPLQLFESWWNHYIWEVYSANWWDALKTTMPAAGIAQQKGLSSSAQHSTACHKTNTPKGERIGLQSFASSTIFTWSLTNQLPLLQGSWQLFAGRMLSQTNRR